MPFVIIAFNISICCVLWEIVYSVCLGCCWHWSLLSFPTVWQNGKSVLAAAAEVGSIALFDWLVETYQLDPDQWSAVSAGFGTGTHVTKSAILH